eukprot:4916718-Alexandrium_andersonii.AAC.1
MPCCQPHHAPPRVTNISIAFRMEITEQKRTVGLPRLDELIKTPPPREGSKAAKPGWDLQASLAPTGQGRHHQEEEALR